MFLKIWRTLLLAKAHTSILVALLTIFSLSIAATAKIPTENTGNKQTEPLLERLQADTIRDKQTEAKQYVKATNMGQQAYYTEYGRFTSNWGQLGIGIITNTANYTYRISNAAARSVRITATPKDNRLKSYTGAVFLIGSGNRSITQPVICESNAATRTPPAIPRIVRNTIQCPAVSTKI